MPKQYEAIRDRLIEKGKSEREAKRIAAKTYNKRARGLGVRPVTGKHKKAAT